MAASALAGHPEQPHNQLPALPPAQELETRAVLKACIEARAALAALKQATSRYLHDLAALGVLREMPLGKEKLFIHPKLMQLLSRDINQFQPYV